MGIYKFKFSDMIPNAWFYKLKTVSKARNQNDTRNPTNQNYQPKTKSSSTAAAAPPQSHPLCYQRKSYHFTRDLPMHPQTDPNINISAPHFSEPPRKSTKTRLSTKKIRPSNGSSPRLLRASSIYANCSCSSEDDDDDDDDHFPELGSESGEESFDKMVSWSNSCHRRVKSNILFDTDNNPKFKKHSGFDSVSQFNLPPIITKTYKSVKNEAATKFRRRSAKIEEMSSYITSNSSKEQRINSPFRKLSVKPPGVKLRTNSPRIASKSFLQVHDRKSVSSGKGGGGRRSLSEIFAVVKSSKDPYRDFKESMVDMIMENSMRTSQDLEDLLACYLSLNSDTYHDLIIKVFKQIWVEITDIRLK